MLGCILLLCTLDSLAFQKTDSTIILGRLGFPREGDSVTLRVAKFYGFNGHKDLYKTYITSIRNTQFRFSIALDAPAYFTVVISNLDRKVNIDHYLIEPADSIMFDVISADSINFSGKKADRMYVQFENRKIYMECFGQTSGRSPDNIKQTFETFDAYAIRQLDFIKRNKKILGDTLYTIMMADVLGESGLKIDHFFPYNSPAKAEVWLKVLRDYRNEVWERSKRFNLNDDLLRYSWNYPNAMIAKYRWDSSVITRQPFSVSRCYEYFRKNYSGALRERIVTLLLYMNKNKSEELSACVKSALTYASHKDLRPILQNMHDHLTVGSTAYEFQLQDTSGVMRRFSEFKGKVVLLDFWFTGCSACIQLHPKIDSIISLYKKSDLVLISISIDKNRDKWIESVRKGLYTSDHAINLYTSGLRDAHPVVSHYFISAYPSLILIDKQGKLCNTPIDPRLDNGNNLIELIDQSLKTLVR